MLRRTNARAQQSFLSTQDASSSSSPPPSSKGNSLPKRKRKSNTAQSEGESRLVLAAITCLATLIVFFLGAYVYILSGAYAARGQPDGAWKEKIAERSENLVRGADILVEGAEGELEIAKEEMKQAEGILEQKKESFLKRADQFVNHAEDTLRKRKNALVQRLRRRKGTAWKDNKYPPAFPIVTRDDKVASKLSNEAIDICTKTLWHTVETTTIVLPQEETFIHTGDIDDLWLRVRLALSSCTVGLC